MNRTVAAQDRDNESFAGLMEHLTQRAPMSGRDRKLRPLLPMTEVKQTRQRSKSEDMELSYEKALRLHGRRRLSEDDDFDPPIPQTQAKIAAATNPARNSAQPSSPRPQKLSRKAEEQQETTSPEFKRGSKAVIGAKSRRVAAAKARKGSTGSTTRRTASPQTQAKAIAMLNETKAALAALERQPEGHPLTLQLDHSSASRRSMISVRLNEEEFSRLRTRANESGLSVSAYMRSCVLDAEQLRAQVKQALAEMRAYSRPADSARFSALARTVNSSAENTGIWSRIIARSATFFGGLWYPSRRSA